MTGAPTQKGAAADCGARERAFAPPELKLMLAMPGMPLANMWGGTAGNWGRQTLALDEFEIMVVACRTGGPMA